MSSNKGMLVAIDNADLVKELTRALRDNNVLVFTALDENDVLNCVERTTVNLLILQCSLISTLLEEYVNLLRSINPRLLIILLFKTDNLTEKTIQKVLKSGIYSYIVEPYNAEIIFHHISSALEHKKISLLKDVSDNYQSTNINIRDAILNNYEDVVFVIQNNRFKYVNKAGNNLLKYSLDSLRKFIITDITPDNNKNSLFDNIKNCMNSEQAIKKEIVLINSEGEEVHLHAKFVPFEYTNKPAVIVFAKEISQTKVETEEMMQLSAAVKSLNSAVTITDMSKNIIYINPVHKDVFGYDLNELIGKKLNILYPFDEHGGLSDKIYEAVQLVGWEGERLGVRKNGEVFPVYEKTAVVKDKNKNQIAMVSVVEDITQRKKLQKDLLESEERYRNLVESANRAIVAFDEDGKITFFNTAAEVIFGYDRQHILNNLFEMLITQKYKWVFRENLSKYFDPNNTSFSNSLELTGLRKSGDEFPMECSLSYCKINKRNIYTAIIGDITERKNLQEQLIHSSKMAAIGQLLSGVTHEVKNPLTIIMGYSDMMLHEIHLDNESQQNLKIIYEEADRAAKVIQNLLSFSRKRTSEKRPTSINKILENTVNLKKIDFKKHNIEIIEYLEPNLPYVMADEHQLQQVFLNLLINAQDALIESENNKKIIIKTSLEPNGHSSEDKDKNVSVYIQDFGCGIDEINLKKIFDPFFSTKPVGAGTGLGLSVSYGIIKNHGGEIKVESTVKKGTTFILSLPILLDSQIPTM